MPGRALDSARDRETEPMASCKEVSQMISEWLEWPLPVGQGLAVRLLLAICKLCSRYQRQLRFLQQATQRLPELGEESSPHALSIDARRRIRFCLDELG